MSGISSIIDRVLSAQESGRLKKKDIYFRGQRSEQKLSPSLLRAGCDYKKENNLYCDCLVMGGVEILNCKTSWERLAIFQHYGIPTRLMDWSSSLINALYFAIEDCVNCDKIPCERNEKDCEGNPVLWVLDPEKMHQKYYPDAHKTAFTVGVDSLPDYVDEFVKQNETERKWPYNEAPIFLEIPWNSPRISRQKGYFTFHPNEKPLDSLMKPKDGLIKIELKKKLRNEVRDEFRVIGVDEHDIYTDLVSLSRHLRRKHSV